MSNNRQNRANLNIISSFRRAGHFCSAPCTVELKGQMTVMAALVFGLMVSLLTVMIEAAICQGARNRACAITNVSVQSVFSQFSSPLADEYEVFGGVIYESDAVLSLLNQYVYENCDNSTQALSLFTFNPYGIKLSEAEIEEIKLLTDDNGEHFYDEIVEYMKLGQFTDNVSDMLSDFTSVSESDGINAVSEELTKRQKEAAQIDALILKLLMQVEGVKTNSSGFSQFFGSLSSYGTFVKKICVNGTGYGSTGLDNTMVYNAVSSDYYDIIEKLSNLKSELDWIKYVYYYPLTQGSFIDTGFRYNAGLICSVVSSVSGRIDDALETIEKIENKSSTLVNNLKESKTILADNKSKMTDELAASYSQEFDELAGYEDGSVNTLCDVSIVKLSLLSCRESIMQISDAVNALASCEMDISTIDSVYGMIDDCISVCRSYPGADIQFNYDNVTLGKGKELSTLESIGNVFANGVMGFVIDDISTISSYKTSQKDLSSMHCDYSKVDFASDKEGLSSVYQDYLYNKYIKSYCNSYTDYISGMAQSITGTASDSLKYEMEYVLSGKTGDKENLEAAVGKVLGVRYVFDLSYIMCDTVKKQECLEMSILLLGFTGVYGVIKAGQYMLLSAWAYAEAVNDVKILMHGGKVSIKKSSDGWKTDLESIIEGKISDDNNSKGSGIDYETYLQLLYFVENKADKVFYTMDVLEQNMAQKGYSHIRMYRYLYSVKGSISYTYRKSFTYTQKFEFSY